MSKSGRSRSRSRSQGRSNERSSRHHKHHSHHSHHHHDHHDHHDHRSRKTEDKKERKRAREERTERFSPPDVLNKRVKIKSEFPEPKEEKIIEDSKIKLGSIKIKEEKEDKKGSKIMEKLKRITGLADEFDDENASDWVKRSRQRQELILQEEKKKAELKARLLDETDEVVDNAIEQEVKIKSEYSDKDLTGLKVAHSEKYIKEGHQIILTLKDKDVLDEEEEDVLENVNIVDEEKAAKNVENKLKKPDYRPYDEPEFDEFGIIMKKTVLSKYDEDIDGVKKSSFVIGNINKKSELELIREKLNQQKGSISLEMPAAKVASEYYTEEEMKKFKKPKNTNKKIRKKPLDVLELPIVDDKIDHGSRNNKINSNESTEILVKPNIQVDFDIEGPEEDLSGILLEEEEEAEIEFRKALEKARRFKESESVSEEERIAQIVKEKEIKQEKEDDGYDFGKQNIIINSTAEFCRNLGDISTLKVDKEEDDEPMDFEKESYEERKIKVEAPEVEMVSKWSEVNLDTEKSLDERTLMDSNQPILEEEPDLSTGLVGALKLAMKKGYLDKEISRPIGGTRSSLLQAQNYTIEEKFYEDDKVGRRERYIGPVSEFKEKPNYVPDVKLEYVDEKGRMLNQKEAFRVLSHKFHGKGPGKNKIDKRMKKLDQDIKLRSMNSIDTPLGTLKLLQDKQKEMHSPYIVLTGPSPNR